MNDNFYFFGREENKNVPCEYSIDCGGRSWVYDDDGGRHCDECGGRDPHYREYDARPPYSRQSGKYNPNGGVVSWGFGRGRYKEKFHLNERLAQWCLRDPLIPVFDWGKIRSVAHSGAYGPVEDFTRATVITMTRNMGFQKYRERWKRILVDLTRQDYELPDNELLLWLVSVFERVVSSFMSKRCTMPKSTSKDGSTSFRHNFLSYNYAIVKLLEARGVYHFHWEFPLPRSHLKLHALDDVFSLIAKEMSLPFHRSVVFKRGKYKKFN
jgi:hypothetical protein